MRFVHRRENTAGHDEHATGQGEDHNPHRRNRGESEHLDQDKSAAVRQDIGQGTGQSAHGHQDERAKEFRLWGRLR